MIVNPIWTIIFFVFSDVGRWGGGGGGWKTDALVISQMATILGSAIVDFRISPKLQESVKIKRKVIKTNKGTPI